jgi:hypothetical protein
MLQSKSALMASANPDRWHGHLRQGLMLADREYRATSKQSVLAHLSGIKKPLERLVTGINVVR